MSDVAWSDRPNLLDVAPEWVTLQEAVYAAGVSGDLVLEWADAGQIDYVSLLPGNDPAGILLRTTDIRFVLGSTTHAMAGAVPSWSRRDEIKTDTGPPHGVNRRRILVVMGAAIAGGLVPVRALAGKPAFKPSTEEMNAVLLRAGKALNCTIEGAVADPSLTVMGEATNVARRGEGKGGASDKGHGSGSGGEGNGDGKDSDKDHEGSGGGTDLSIGSVTVNPDPVAPGGSAVITINTSPNRDRLTFMVTASEGILAQDPQRPGVWTWRDA